MPSIIFDALHPPHIEPPSGNCMQCSFSGTGDELSRGGFIRGSNARVAPVYLRRFYVCTYSIVRGNKAKVKGKIRKFSIKFLMLRTRARSSTQYPTCNPFDQ